MIIQEMNLQDCTALVSRCRLGRLGCVKDGRPYIVPISYAFKDNHLYSFSMEGQKVDWMRANPAVCVLVDEISSPQSWQSVHVEARFEELTEASHWEQRANAWSLLQSRNPIWWVPGSCKPAQGRASKRTGHLFYRLNLLRLTGRRAFPCQ